MILGQKALLMTMTRLIWKHIELNKCMNIIEQKDVYKTNTYWRQSLECIEGEANFWHEMLQNWILTKGPELANLNFAN